MSRARHQAHVHIVADDLDQACDDLTRVWSSERRQLWAIDTGTPGVEHHPPRRPEIDEALRLARLRAERDALAAVIPADHQHDIKRVGGQIAWTRQELYDLNRGGGGLHANTPEGRAALALRAATENLQGAEARAMNKAYPRSQRRAAERGAVTLRARLDDAQNRWDGIGQPVHDRLTTQLDRDLARLGMLKSVQADREDWLIEHPEALPRLGLLDGQVAVDAGDTDVEHPGARLSRPQFSPIRWSLSAALA